MDIYKNLFVFLSLCQLSSARQINVTVMIPGKNSFSNLVSIVSDLRNTSIEERMSKLQHTRKRESEAGNQPNSEDYEPKSYDYNSLSYSNDLDSDFTSCVDPATQEVNVYCVHELGGFVTYPWSYLFVKPALEVALKEIKKTRGLLDGHDINLIYYDSGDERGITSAR